MKTAFLVALATAALLAMAAAEPAKNATKYQIKSTDTDLDSAVDAMKAAYYYGFAMLLQLERDAADASGNGDWTSGSGSGSVTFLVPDDRSLAEARHILPEQLVRAHAITGTALRVNNMLHLPTGTLLPSAAGTFVNVTANDGHKRGMFLDGVRVVHPNVCVSARVCCHGVAGLLRLPSADPNASSTSHSPAPWPAPEPLQVPASSPATAPLPATAPAAAPEPVPGPTPRPSAASMEKQASHRFIISAVSLLLALLL